jgi:uncharacterized protein YqeY
VNLETKIMAEMRDLLRNKGIKFLCALRAIKQRYIKQKQNLYVGGKKLVNYRTKVFKKNGETAQRFFRNFFDQQGGDGLSGKRKRKVELINAFLETNDRGNYRRVKKIL